MPKPFASRRNSLRAPGVKDSSYLRGGLMHENEKYPGVPERIQLMDENGKVHENPTFSSYVQDVDAEQLAKPTA